MDQIRQLREAAGGAIVAFGGVRAVRALVEADLVDQYWLKINPTVTGHGGSMFAGLEQQRALP